MRDYLLLSLGELLEREEYSNLIKSSLSEFNCKSETDLEDFLSKNAIEYQRNHFGKTFIFVDKQLLEEGSISIMAFFTIGLTSLDISGLKKKAKKKLLGSVPGRDNMTSYSAFLIGQLGRADNYTRDDIDGSTILNECYCLIDEIQQKVGGRLIILECRPHLFEKFYSKHDYKKLNESTDRKSKTLIYTLYKKVEPIVKKV